MAVEVNLKGKVGEGYVYHILGTDKVVNAGEAIEVDISSVEFRRQWWKIEFEGGSFKQVGQDLEFVPSEDEVPAEDKKKSKAK